MCCTAPNSRILKQNVISFCSACIAANFLTISILSMGLTTKYCFVCCEQSLCSIVLDSWLFSLAIELYCCEMWWFHLDNWMNKLFRDYFVMRSSFSSDRNQYAKYAKKPLWWNLPSTSSWIYPRSASCSSPVFRRQRSVILWISMYGSDKLSKNLDWIQIR